MGHCVGIWKGVDSCATVLGYIELRLRVSICWKSEG